MKHCDCCSPPNCYTSLSPNRELAPHGHASALPSELLPFCNGCWRYMPLGLEQERLSLHPPWYEPRSRRAVHLCKVCLGLHRHLDASLRHPSFGGLPGCRSLVRDLEPCSAIWHQGVVESCNGQFRGCWVQVVHKAKALTGAIRVGHHAHPLRSHGTKAPKDSVEVNVLCIRRQAPDEERHLVLRAR